MFCKSCGKQIDKDSIFCSFCGTKQNIHQIAVLYSVTDPIENTKPKLDKSLQQTKYDLNYQREEDAFVAGIIFLIIAILMAIVGPILVEDGNTLIQFQGIAAIISLIFRICVTLWVVGIANRQNRETVAWGIFAFFLPSIALLVISCQKKLIPKVIVREDLNNEQNSEILAYKAQDFLKENKISESGLFAEKSLELNPNNLIAAKVLAEVDESILAQQDFKNNIQTVYLTTTNNIRLKVVYVKSELIGARVIINKLPAQDDTYLYKNSEAISKIQTENGIITSRVFLVNYKSFYVEQQKEFVSSIGDKAFTLDGQPLPTGKYKMGFMSSNMVEDGVISKFV